MRDYTYFNDISNIHNIVQKIKTSNVGDDLKDMLFEEYNSVLSNLKILSDGHISSIDQLSSEKALTEDFLKEMINAANNLEQSTKSAQEHIHRIKYEENKFDRIAVIFVGHIRTLAICLPNNMHFFNKMSKQVDYYVVTWDQFDYESSDYQRDGLLDMSKKVNQHRDIEVYFGSLLKGIKMISSDTLDFNKISNSERRGLWKMLNLTYLSKIGNSLKQTYEKENDFIYDQVIEMRPDIVHDPHRKYKDTWFFKCKDNELVTDLCKYNTLQTDSEILIGNWYWRMNSNTHNKFSKIYDFLINSPNTQIQKTTSFHSVLIDYFYKNPYKIYKGLDSFETVHVKTPDDLTPI